MSVNNATGNLSVAESGGLTSTSMTVSAWVFVPSDPSPTPWTLFSLDDTANIFFQIASSVVSDSFFLWSETSGGGTAGIAIFTMASAIGKWVFIALVGAPTTSVAYWSIAGAAISSQNISSSAAGATKLWISDDGFGSGDFPGLITGVKVWSTALTAAQIANEAQQLPPVLLSNVWAQYPELNSTSPNIDYSGNGRNATVGGTLSVSGNMPPVPWHRNQNVMSM